MLNSLRAAVHRWTAPGAAPPGPDSAEVAKAMAKLDTGAVAKRFGGGGPGLQGLMSPAKPGNWGGDHAAEARHFTGFTYAAIDQLAKQAMQADIECYRDVGQFSFDQLGALWDRRKGRLRKVKARKLTKGYGDETLEAELLPPEHPLCKILLRPNPDQTGGLFNYERVMQICLTGCCFVWNVPNPLGKTVHRYVLPTSAMRAEEPRPGLPNGGWRIDPSAGCEADEEGFRPTTFHRLYTANCIIPAEEVRVCGYPHPTRKDDFQSPLAAIALWIDTADMLAEARHSQLKHGGVPSIWLTEPEESDASEEEATATALAIRASMSGPDNHRKVMYGRKGLDAKALSPNAAEMDFSGGHNQLRDAVLSGFRTPAAAVGADTPKTYGAAKSVIDFYKWAVVDSMLCFLSDDDTAFFAKPFGKGLSVWLEAKEFEDPELTIKGLVAAATAGNVITVNEYRSRMKLDPLDDERGDEFAGAAAAPPVAVDAFGKPVPPGAQPDQPKPDDAADEGEEPETPAPFGIRRPRFNLPSSNGNGKAKTNGYANGHDHFADVGKMAHETNGHAKRREYLPEGAPPPATIDEALGVIAENWASY